MYVALYLAVAVASYVLTPVFYKLWGWDLSNHRGNPPPQITAIAWPLIIVYYIGTLSYKILMKMLAWPFRLVDSLHEKVADYVSDEAAVRRKAKKTAKAEAKKLKKKMAEQDAKLEQALDNVLDDMSYRDLGYREANCNGCGQVLKKIV